MDVTPPGAAGTASRPSRTTPSRIPLVLRRLAIGLAGAALAVLAGAACALSFDDLRTLALSGRAEPRLAYLYPATFDVLLVVALVSVPVLRAARFLVRLQAGFVLVLLLVSAAAANAATAVGVSFDPDAAALVVALLPWVMLSAGLWLLLLLLKHVRTNRADLDGDSDDDLVPFVGEREPRAAATAPYPVPANERPAIAHAVTEEHGAPPLQPVPEAVAPPGYAPPVPVSPVSETVAPPEYAPPLPITPPHADDEALRPATPDTVEEDVRLPQRADTAATVEPETDQAPDRAQAEATDQATPDEAESLPVVPPTAAPGTPPVTEPAPEPMTDATVTDHAVADETAPGGRASDAEPADTTPGSTPDRATGAATEPTTEPTTEPSTEPTAEPTPEAAAAPAPDADPEDRPARQPRRNRPVRWGDLVRPHTGDVLVHPRPKPEEPAGAEPAEDESGVDTQPLRQIKDVPDPAHTRDNADPDEVSGTAQAADDESVPLAPPSGRLRSTPRPPD
ncbi:DUF2637 domain-containing protein [Microbispora sp. H11081]|uniref:DUF2637 domain-containing protein n=1 Tax=Microbispora sp. H11081 TaxID=2729107 RepID=UPI0014766A5B|nr:DUF2637 domain-containing protein [Microbispora sp. H11081]